MGKALSLREVQPSWDWKTGTESHQMPQNKLDSGKKIYQRKDHQRDRV